MTARAGEAAAEAAVAAVAAAAAVAEAAVPGLEQRSALARELRSSNNASKIRWHE